MLPQLQPDLLRIKGSTLDRVERLGVHPQVEREQDGSQQDGSHGHARPTPPQVDAAGRALPHADSRFRRGDRRCLRLGREKSQVSRALRALEGEGLVERDPLNRTYQLGSGLYTLAARGIQTRLMRAASGHLDRLADEQHANVRLCVLIGAKVVTLISSPPHDAAGAEAPTQTPCGPVLTSDWPDAALRELVPVCAPGPNNLLASCAQARARGYVYYPGNDAGPARYAAPVRDFRGIVLAAIQLAQEPGEEAAGDVPAPEKAVVLAANAVSAALGFQG